MDAHASQTNGRYRRLLNNERKFLFTPMACIGVVARLHGHLSEAEVRLAIDKVRVVHPQAAVRVTMDYDWSAWFHTDNVPEIPLRVVERRTDDQWFEELRHEQQTAFDPFTGPLLRFVLLKSLDASDLVAFAQHSICDGTGLAYLTRDVLLHLGNPQTDARPLPLPPRLSPENLPDGVRENQLARFARRLYSRRLNNKWRQEPFIFDMDDFRAIHDAFLGTYTYCVQTVELSLSETEALIAICRSQNVSVNSASTTAFIEAYTHCVGPLEERRRKVAVPVDMRKRLGRQVGDVLDLYVGTVMFDFRYDVHKSFWDNARVFDRTAHKKMESLECFEVMYQMEDMDGSLMDALLGFGTMSQLVPPGTSKYEKLSAFTQDRDNAVNQLAERFMKALPGVINTNLANMDFPRRYGDFELERMFFAPATGPQYPLVLGVITTSGRLTLTLNYMEEATGSPTMAAIRERAVALLGLSANAAVPRDRSPMENVPR